MFPRGTNPSRIWPQPYLRWAAPYTPLPVEILSFGPVHTSMVHDGPLTMRSGLRILVTNMGLCVNIVGKTGGQQQWKRKHMGCEIVVRGRALVSTPSRWLHEEGDWRKYKWLFRTIRRTFLRHHFIVQKKLWSGIGRFVTSRSRILPKIVKLLLQVLCIKVYRIKYIIMTFVLQTYNHSLKKYLFHSIVRDCRLF
jgi:hypothetical protein